MAVNAITSRLYQKAYRESRTSRPLAYAYEKLCSKTPTIFRDLDLKNGLLLRQSVQPKGTNYQTFIRHGVLEKSVMVDKAVKDGKDVSSIYVFNWLMQRGKIIFNIKTPGVNNEFRQIVLETDGKLFNESGKSHIYKVGEPRKTEEYKVPKKGLNDAYSQCALLLVDADDTVKFVKEASPLKFFSSGGQRV